MTTNEIKEKFELAKSRQLLCRFSDVFQNGSFVQVELTVVSEEANIVGVLDYEENAFGYDSNKPFYYVKFDYFVPFLEDVYDEDFDTMTWDKQIALVRDYLDDKLIIINPYYYYNKDQKKFFKNGLVSNIINKKIEYYDSYFSIPIISTEETFIKFKGGNPFNLNASNKIMGKPDYLFYNNTLYRVELDLLKSNDSYYQKNKSDVLDLDINYLTENKDLIISDNKSYVFIRKEAIFNLKSNTKPIIKEEKKVETSIVVEVLNNFLDFTKSSNLCYTKNDIYNFYTCVCASQLIILAGMSGMGKTRLPLKFAEYFNMSEESETLLFVPVSPAYTEPSDVLGYLNPMSETYISSDTRLVEFLHHAELNPNKMHMVLFDEMNLAQIEFWFAPFMSILERDIKDRKITLYSNKQSCKNKNEYPPTIAIGRNIIFIGTINLDETTKNISDRLLDRAYIINLKKESFINYHNEQINKSAKAIPLFKGDFMSCMPSSDESEFNYISGLSLKQLEFFDRVHDELNKIDAQKGISFRSVKNIALYLKHKPLEFDEKLAFDFAFKQTVMKKINGSSDSISQILGTLNNEGNPTGLLINIFDEFAEVSDFTECRNEIKNKLLEIKKFGYAR